MILDCIRFPVNEVGFFFSPPLQKIGGKPRFDYPMKFRSLIFFALLFAIFNVGLGQITVNGISDRGIENDRVSFEIPSTVGFTTEAFLNGSPLALDLPVEITTAGYYELSVTKTDNIDLTGESRLIRFIVVDTSRGTSERGLMTWTPYPTIDSAPEAFAGCELEVLVPAALPLGFDIPVITRLRDTSTGAGVRLNGTIKIPEVAGSSMSLLRGFGSTQVPAPASGGEFVFTPGVASLAAPIRVQIEPTTVWTTVSSDINTSTAWSSNARIHVTTDLTVSAGATLAIGPGTVVQLDPGVDIEVEGALEINGSAANPVYFTNVPGRGAWGGFFLRQATAVVNATGAIFTGSGADERWFSGSGYSHHRAEQATFLIDSSEPCSFHNCFFIDLPGQALHGKNATIEVSDCLIQRVPTVGQFNGGNVTVTRSALIEFPGNTDIFTDDDNDGIYFTAGSHRLIETVIGWAKDDGVDAGSGNSGSVSVTHSWFEACFHEGMAWSGPGRTIDVSDSVVMNSGQGIEAGWSGRANNGSPVVTVTQSLCLGNHIGLRYGDNYTWDYDGRLDVSGSLALFNDRDVWGMEWDSWTYRSEQMKIENNHLSVPDDRHPDNMLWDGNRDFALLASFAPVADSPVGGGFAEWSLQKSLSQYEEGVTVCLSEFSTLPAGIDYEVASGFSKVLARGTIRFAPGEVRKRIALPTLETNPRNFVRVTLTGSSACTLTTQRNFFFIADGTAAESRVLIPAGANWRYLDDGSDQGIAWREPDFDDSSWQQGVAQLGYGDGDEATVVSFGGDSSRKHATTYFRNTFSVADPSRMGDLRIRLVRDDGAIVCLNGEEVLRSNIDPGPVAFDTYTGKVTPSGSENRFVEEVIAASGLLPGENTIAVEVHQASGSSSDMSFDFELLAVPRADVLLFLVRSAGETNLLWQADDRDTLQVSPSLETGWTDIPKAVSPLTIMSDALQPQRFFRLVR